MRSSAARGSANSTGSAARHIARARTAYEITGFRVPGRALSRWPGLRLRKRHDGCQATLVPGRAANARMPETKIRPPATMNIRLTELRVTPANEARKLRRTVLDSQPEMTTAVMDASWLTGVNTAITRPRYSRGAASKSSGATAVFSIAIGMAWIASMTRPAGKL